MLQTLEQKLVVAISSRVLFDLSTSNAIYETQGKNAYAQYQIEHEQDILQPGEAFNLVKKFLNLNKYGNFIEVILLSRNSADTGLRIFNSIKHYHLDITRAVFTSGESPHHYAEALRSHLFLSVNPDDVRAALDAGFAAATILSSNATTNSNEQLRIAFDGDAIIFSDESEKIYQEQGLDAFLSNEQKLADRPLPAGPFRNLLQALHNIQTQFKDQDCPIRTALITARSVPAHERVIKTLRSWNIRIDEAAFLGGLEKGEFLKAFKADIFFDDQKGHCESTRKHVATGHVPYGCKNK